MLNLATLSALLRTLRQSGEGVTAPVARIPHVRRVAAEGELRLPDGSLPHERPRSTLLPLPIAHDDARPSRPGAGAAPPVASQGTSPPAAARLAGATPPPTDAEVASTSLDLTRAGALVSVALRSRAAQLPAPPRVQATEPLVATARASPFELARALARSLTDSGLFYEAHLARWTRQEYPQSALSREPQSAWMPGDAAGAIAGRTGALPEAAATLLTRQLDALDTRGVTWSGQAWPGQSVSITFEEAPAAQEDGGAPTGPDKPTPWATRVALQLPSLGQVHARLMLAGGRLDLTLDADDAEAVARLTEARTLLAAQLAESQIALGRFAVGPTRSS